MKENIQFSIGSAFKGEGFTRAANTVNQMNKNVKKGVEASGQLAGVLGQVDASAGRAVTAMTGMIQALMSMNATVIISQAAILALNLVLDDMKKKAEACKAKAEELRVSMEKAFSVTMAERMQSIKAEAGNIVSSFDKLTKQANDFTAALEGVRAAEANGGVVQLQVEKLNKLIEAHSEEERQNIEQEYNLRIAIQKRVNVEEQWNEKIAAAHQAVVDGENRIGKIDEQLAIIEENRRNLEETMLAAKQSNDSHWLEIQKNVNALKEEEAKLLEKRNDTESQIDVLREKEKATKQEAINAEASATVEVRNVELAAVKLKEAQHERELAEKAATEAVKQKAASDKSEAEEIKTAADMQREANEAQRALKNAEVKYAQALRDYTTPENLAHLAAETMIKSTKGLKKGVLPVDVQKSIVTKVTDLQLKEAVARGEIKSVKDYERAQRQMQRDLRDQLSRESGQHIREIQRYERLSNMNPDALCSSDLAFMQKYEMVYSQNQKRQETLDAAKLSLDEQKKKAATTAEKLVNIEAMMKKLGLK